MTHDLTLNAALQHIAEGDTRMLSGGTDYYPGLSDANPDPHLLNVHRISELAGISLVQSHWRIGANVTWAELINASLPDCFACLKQAGKEVGSIQIQNAATIVGNICNASPAADGVPALLVLDAEVELRSVDGVRVVALAEFITGVRETILQSNELVTAILIPDDLQNDRTEFVKLGSRTYLVISIVMCAVRLRVDASNTITAAAIAVGACSPVAIRLTKLEQALVGLSCDQEALSDCITGEHLSQLTPIDDVRASAEYRLQAANVLVQRLIIRHAEAVTDAKKS